MAHDCCHSGPPAALAARSVAAHAEETVQDVVRQHPAALEVMRSLGINHCCGAHLTLREASAAAGVALDALLVALEDACGGRA